MQAKTIGLYLVEAEEQLKSGNNHKALFFLREAKAATERLGREMDQEVLISGQAAHLSAVMSGRLQQAYQ